MRELPGCPCSICEEESTMTDIVGGEMSDNPPVSDIVLRDRIAEALKTADRRVAGFIGYDEMADAVIAVLIPESDWKEDDETD